MNKTLFDLLIQHHNSLTSRDFFVDYFVQSDFMTKQQAITSGMIKEGKLFVEDDKLFVVESVSGSEITQMKELPLIKDKLNIYNRFELKSGMIENFNNTKPIITTLGVYILNVVMLTKIFGNLIPYVNGKFNMGNINTKICKLGIEGKITADQIYRYVDHVYFISSFTDFITCGLTEKSITPDEETIKLRDRLFLEYKDQLDDPNVMVDIENQVINSDKANLKDDPSSGFLIKGKNFDIQRKRMFYMLGLVEKFGDEVEGYDFSKTNLNDGWKIDTEMPIIANNIRSGSYHRAKSTALGGYGSKLLGRNFQDSLILEEDCGATKGLIVFLTSDNIKLFHYHNIIEGDKLVELTEENESKYVNKIVQLRSAMFCDTKDGYCYACMDSKFRTLGIKLLNIYPINIGSTFLSNSLKKTHGTKIDTLDITDLNELLF